MRPALRDTSRVWTSDKHTNDECFKQKDIRTNKEITSYKLIAALIKLYYQENKEENTRNQSQEAESGSDTSPIQINHAAEEG